MSKDRERDRELIGLMELILLHAKQQIHLAKMMLRLNDKLGDLGLPPNETESVKDSLAQQESTHEKVEADIEFLKAKLPPPQQK